MLGLVIDEQVLQLPGVLDFRVLCILSMLWPGHWEHMRIFAQVTHSTLILTVQKLDV